MKLHNQWDFPQHSQPAASAHVQKVLGEELRAEEACSEACCLGELVRFFQPESPKKGLQTWP